MRTSYTIYHANTKNTGSAIRMSLFPAHEAIKGSILIELANQKISESAFPSWDWEHRLMVKLDVSDLSHILCVLRGMQESVCEGKGLYHQSQYGSTIVKFSHHIDPVCGYRMVVSKGMAGEDIKTIEFFFNPKEAFALSLALEQAMMFVVFGIPEV